MIKIILLSFLFFISLFIIPNIHAYLSFSKPINADILLVEGWISVDYAPKILKEYYRNHYSRIVVIGETKPDIVNADKNDRYTNPVKLSKSLRSFSKNKIVINLVNARYVEKHQTLNYMVCFKNWLFRELPNAKSVNLFSASAHSRKSFLLLRRVLPASIKLGVISAAPITYNAKYWWLSKRGIWVVFKNSIAYIYAFAFENFQSLKC